MNQKQVLVQGLVSVLRMIEKTQWENVWKSWKVLVQGRVFPQCWYWYW